MGFLKVDSFFNHAIYVNAILPLQLKLSFVFPKSLGCLDVACTVSDVD